MEFNSIDSRLEKLNTLTDVELFSALRSGQKEALGIIYDRYAALVYSLALKILANSQEAEDLTHEVFISLWRKPNYDRDRGSIESFLAVMTRSRAIDKLRSRSRKFAFLHRWGLSIKADIPPPTPMENASLAQRAEKVQKALGQLSQQQRQVLEMSYFQGYSQSQIAKQLNIPLGTIKSYCRQGLIKMRQVLQDLNP